MTNNTKDITSAATLKYGAIAAREYGIGGGVNGTGKREMIKGAFTIEVATGRKVRAFRENEGGFVAAQKWAEVLNVREVEGE